MREATRKPWVVYSKRPFAGPEQVLAYLSRYTHRVGISNRRLLALDRQAGTVTFDYKDYADGARHKSMTLQSGRVHPPAAPALAAAALRENPPLRPAGQPRPAGAAPAGARTGWGRPKLPAPSRRRAALPKCPHCGWAALFLVRVFRPCGGNPRPR